MGRVTPLWKLQKELEFAQKRETYLKRTDRPIKQTVDKRIKKQVGYRSSLVKIGANNALIALQVSAEALAKFGDESILGLVVDTGTALAEAIKEPKGFKPAQIHGLVGTTTPTVVTAKGSGRRYIKYGANAAGAAQASYTCAISSGDTSPTPQEQRAKAETVAQTYAATFQATSTGYGRIWFTAEEYTVSLV